VVDQVLVAEGRAADARAQQIAHGMPDCIGEAQIGEALRQPPAEPDPPIRRRQQHHTCVRGDGAAVESAHKPASAGASQIKFSVATLCWHRGLPAHSIKSLSQNNVL